MILTHGLASSNSVSPACSVPLLNVPGLVHKTMLHSLKHSRCLEKQWPSTAIYHSLIPFLSVYCQSRYSHILGILWCIQDIHTTLLHHKNPSQLPRLPSPPMQMFSHTYLEFLLLPVMISWHNHRAKTWHVPRVTWPPNHSDVWQHVPRFPPPPIGNSEQEYFLQVLCDRYHTFLDFSDLPCMNYQRF